MRYCFYIVFIFGIILSNQFTQDDLKQAKVVEFISTKTIDYIELLKNSGEISSITKSIYLLYKVFPK